MGIKSGTGEVDDTSPQMETSLMTPIKQTALLGLLLLLLGCDLQQPEARKPELLIYCGVNLLQPLTEIAAIVEQERAVTITFSQGAAADRYQSMLTSQVGDLYLASGDYLQQDPESALFVESEVIGYTQAVLAVAKGNPRQVSGHLGQLLRDDLAVVIGAPDVDTIGMESRRLLRRVGIYPQVLQHSVFLAADADNLSRVIKQQQADVVLNWRSAALLPEYRQHIDMLELDAGLVKLNELQLSRLSFSNHPQLASYVIQVATSERGQEIIRRYGLLDHQQQSQADAE